MVDGQAVDPGGSGRAGRTLFCSCWCLKSPRIAVMAADGGQLGGHGFLRESAAEISDAALGHMLPVNQAEVLLLGAIFSPQPPQTV